jgi:hypothetical protein
MLICDDNGMIMAIEVTSNCPKVETAKLRTVSKKRDFKKLENVLQTKHLTEQGSFQLKPG